jgi:methionine synthase II (cobalamin-independent)
MPPSFRPNCLPVLIGSLPLEDHHQALRLVLRHTPEIPVWAQLPAHPQEGMMAQFLPGLPGLKTIGERQLVDTADGGFDDGLVAFYEAYLAVSEGAGDLDGSRFALTPATAGGFFALLQALKDLQPPPAALKGQVTGPFTLTTGVSDQDKRAIFYNPQVRDAAVKLLALKARWQVRRLGAAGCPVIIFIDEPALAGFGTSEFISVSKDEVAACLEEVIAAIHAEGGLAGVHVCANTDWSVVLDSEADIVNFDAYAYFDKFILYPDRIKAFVARGGILAWGIVPTLRTEDIERETAGALADRWQTQARQVAALGLAPAAIQAQSLISPSCGVGALSLAHATRVLELTRAVSLKLRATPIDR